MTLSFSTKWPKKMGKGLAGEPNHFVEKIWAGLLENGLLSNSEGLYYSNNGKRFDNYSAMAGKLHTIRADKKDRWKLGKNIHPVINNRTKNRFQFAPVIPVKSVQKIEIRYFDFDANHVNNPFLHKISTLKSVQIKIDGKMLDTDEMKLLAENDGFVNLYGFFAWFNSDFQGKIIHWTNLKY